MHWKNLSDLYSLKERMELPNHGDNLKPPITTIHIHYIKKYGGLASTKEEEETKNHNGNLKPPITPVHILSNKTTWVPCIR